MCLPLQTVFHIYAYLKKRQNSRLALDPSYPKIDMRTFHQADWTDFYGDVKEAIPDNAPEPNVMRMQASQPPYVYMVCQELLMDVPFAQAKQYLSKLPPHILAP